MIHDYIENRLRAIPTPNCGVLPDAPPIIAFGNFESARLATVGINPSHREFSHGYVRGGFGDLRRAPMSVLREILDDQYSYFKRPQYRWFNRLATVVEACGASYADGSAASLDIVQWATQPVWGKLTMRQKCALLKRDVPFLGEQLRNESIRTLLVNGRAVMDVICERLGLQLTKVDTLHGLPGTPTIPDTHFFTGRLFGKVDVVAWNVNLQGTPGVLDSNVGVIAERVGRLVRPAARNGIMRPT